MDPSFFAVPELPASVSGGSTRNTGAKKSSGSLQEDPTSTISNRRRVLRGVMQARVGEEECEGGEGGDYAHMTTAALLLGGDGDDDEEDDGLGGFAMPSIIPTDASSFGGGASTSGRGGALTFSTKGGSALPSNAAATAFYEVQRATLLSAKEKERQRAENRKRERDAMERAMLDDLAGLVEGGGKCARCHVPLFEQRGATGLTVSATEQEDLLALYRRAIHSHAHGGDDDAPAGKSADGGTQTTTRAGTTKSTPSSKNAASRVSSSSSQAVPIPQLWCPACISFAPALKCPLCPTTTSSSGGGVPASPATTLHTASPFALEASDIFGPLLDSAMADAIRRVGTHYMYHQQHHHQQPTSSRTIRALPMIACLRCKRSYHGHCLGMDDGMTVALSTVGDYGKYCCPQCSLGTAVLEVRRGKDRRGAKRRETHRNGVADRKESSKGARKASRRR